MRETDLKRRDFHRLTMAAFGGMVAGGCTRSGGNGQPAAQAEDEDQKENGEKPQVNVDPALLLTEPHVCRGLNTCEGKGKGEENACAGQGSCAVVDAHTCAGTNECKAQGGCGGYPGQNTCEGKGHCAVPLSEKAWALARKQFEELMEGAGKEVGEAPEAG